METLAHIQQKLNSAEDLKSVVRTMKAMAPSDMGQCERIAGCSRVIMPALDSSLTLAFVAAIRVIKSKTNHNVNPKAPDVQLNGQSRDAGYDGERKTAFAIQR